MYKCCYVVVVKAHVKIFYCLLLKCFGGLNKNIFKQFSYQGPLSLTQLLQFFILTKLTFVKKMSTLRNIFPFFIFVAFFSSPINNSSVKGLNDVFFFYRAFLGIPWKRWLLLYYREVFHNSRGIFDNRL